MATYKQLQNGSSGSDVKKLQQSLVAAGYDVGTAGVDGIYGNATAAAVKKYQQDKGLDVDGIAGEQTLGSLYGSANQGSQPQQTQPQTTTQPQAGTQKPDYSQYAYDPAADQAYQQALAALQQAQQQLPSYKGTYDQQLEDVYQQIVGRDKFSYDINGDALYQQYADQYTQKGQMAMMDTMGQAAALTGGYGNSYAQSVGQQAYQAYLQQLNDVVPELYGMALDQYNAEGDALMQQFGMLGDMADTEYGRYQDELSQYWQNLSYQKQLADDAYDQGYSNWYNAYQQGYQAERDQIADQQWQAQFDESKRQYDQEYAFAQQQYADSKKASSGGSGGSSGKGSSSGGGYDNGGLTKEQVVQLQKVLGVTADGLYGANSKKAAGGLSAKAAYDKYVGGGGGGDTPKFDYPSNNEAHVEKGGSYYETALADLREMKQSSRSNADANKFLKEMMDNDLLTPSEYSRLYNMYRNNSL